METGITFKTGSRDEIASHWRAECQKLAELLKNADLSRLNLAPAGKWSAVRHVDHLSRSASPVTLSLKLPAFLLRLVMGKPGKPSRPYAEVVAAYENVLKNGGKAMGRYVPAPKLDATKTLSNWQKTADGLAAALNAVSDDRLDGIRLPHPLLGGLTQRELLFFTVYHTAHHRMAIEGLVK